MPQPPETPGVYLTEQNAFPTSVVEVATAVPAFIGYTQRVAYQGKLLAGSPIRVTSLKEFEEFFGGSCRPAFSLAGPAPAPGDITVALADGRQLGLSATAAPYYLHPAIRLFYRNGGATCYVVSLGSYDSPPGTVTDFTAAIDSLVYEQEPTLLLCPDALRLGPADYYQVARHLLAHCAAVQCRVALLDVHGGAGADAQQVDSLIAQFRQGIGENYLSYGVAYFPWVRTTVLGEAEVSFLNLTSAALATLAAALPPAASGRTLLGQAAGLLPDDALPDAAALATARAATHQALLTLFPAYKSVITAVAAYLNTLPVAPALAGVYTALDASRGVWKAPANVSLSGVAAPTVALDDPAQARLSVDAASGKSINAIRTFQGQGPLVWGARTLDGNSQDWRYVNVRRTMILIEQSIKLAARAYVFEPHDANTWTTIKSLISSFLFTLWQQGALTGTAPDDAYQVLVGLGSTMTADDLLNGYLNVTVLVALTRPAEFIELTFQQQMQQS